MGNLNELGKLRDPRRNWYRAAIQVPWPAFAVPLLVRRFNGIAYLLGTSRMAARTARRLPNS